MNRSGFLAFATLALSLISLSAMADLSPEMRRKADTYKAKFSQVATNDSVVRAVAAYNARPSGMSNQRWETLDKDSGEVRSFLNTSVSKMMAYLEKDSNVEAVFIRAKNGDLVAGAQKPVLFNISTRPFYKVALKGEAWDANKLQPHPLTGEKSVVMAVPIRGAGGAVIGMVHAVVKE